MTVALTRELAAFASGLSFDVLPQAVRHETTRALVNWMGCVLGGCDEPVARVAAASVPPTGGAKLVGHHSTSTRDGAAFVNAASASALSFDDTHLATVAHPTGPVASALFASAQIEPVSGPHFLAALAAGIEISCRLANALLLSPARPNVGLYIQGVVGPVGVAAALGRLWTFDDTTIASALGMASSMAGGTRASHGSMTGLIVPAFGARAGVLAATLARQGADCMPNALEGPRGFLEAFSTDASPARALDGLGRTFEVMNNSYKPYPAGIVLHPSVDACRSVATALPADDPIADIRLFVHPLAQTLTDRPEPKNPLEAQISLQHWAAVALSGRPTDARALGEACIQDPAIAALRKKVGLTSDPRLTPDAARCDLVLESGNIRTGATTAARGSLNNPLSDSDLDTKFLSQSSRQMSDSSARGLIQALRALPEANDVAKALAPFLGGL